MNTRLRDWRFQKSGKARGHCLGARTFLSAASSEKTKLAGGAKGFCIRLLCGQECPRSDPITVPRHARGLANIEKLLAAGKVRRDVAHRLNALILVDIQNDFVPGGALPVTGGGQIVPVVNRIQAQFDLVVATQDWHPANHGSFAANHSGKKPGEVIELDGLPQTLWPIHCVQNTAGAAFVPALNMKQVAEVFQKGTDPRIDSYSGFFDNGHRRKTGLGDFLKEHNVKQVFVAGLATDYCVKFTALDAVALGFNTHLVEDACRGVNLNAGDVDKAVEEMRAAGVDIVKNVEMLKR